MVGGVPTRGRNTESPTNSEGHPAGGYGDDTEDFGIHERSNGDGRGEYFRLEANRESYLTMGWYWSYM